MPKPNITRIEADLERKVAARERYCSLECQGWRCTTIQTPSGHLHMKCARECERLKGMPEEQARAFLEQIRRCDRHAARALVDVLTSASLRMLTAFGVLVGFVASAARVK
jgi:hypothetical protein